MPGFRGLWEIRDSMDIGELHYSFWRKTPSQVTNAGQWFDMSMSPGSPLPQYYAAAPLIAQQMRYSTDGGIFHGASVGSLTKHLKRFLIMSASGTGLPMVYTLADYLLYYPFVDTGTTDEQFMTNSVSLPRYTTGAGVMMMPVSVAASSGTGGAQFVVNYTNQAGVSGRISSTVTMNTATANGALITGYNAAANPGLFIGLQSGDLGVRSVQSVKFTSGTDVGLFALVLVKPLLTSALLEQTAPSEIEALPHQAQIPQIFDDAFLNLIVQPQGSLATVAFHGEIETFWN